MSQIETQITQNLPHGLGRIYHPDPRDLNFLMAEHLEEPVTLPPFRYYIPGTILDQGKTPMCVDYSANQWLATSPVRNTRLEPGVIYCEAQKLDPWPGDCTNPQYEGTSVRAAAQALQARGYLDTYIWAFDADTVRRWILSGQGPVQIGSRWYNGMFTPDHAGVVHVNPGDTVAGGHAYLVIGANDHSQCFRLVNSWGKGWGQKGRFWMSYQDLDFLLKQDGEAWTSVEKRLVAPSVEKKLVS
jgi:hypothetical protein